MSGNNKHIEVFCNKFAGEFLVPSEDVQKNLRNKSIDDNLLAGLAKKYSVSREVILQKSPMSANTFLFNAPIWKVLWNKRGGLFNR
jgi:Zn-dependent peptidase ImmA (M78 family)